MKLSKLYSNNQSLFTDIKFNPGFNLILGEIRERNNKKIDTHNLGKTKLLELIDFCFLKERTKEFFLFKHIDIFNSFVFYLEVETISGNFITIRRSVAHNTKISFALHDSKHQDFRSQPESIWAHIDLPIDSAKKILNSYLNLTDIKPSDYRMALSYALRSQNDFTNQFKLSKFQGKHIDWKPYVGKILGFLEENLIENYRLHDEIIDIDKKIADLSKKIDNYNETTEEIYTTEFKSLEQELKRQTEMLDSLDFSSSDNNKINLLSEEINNEIAELNEIKFYIKSETKKLELILNEKQTEVSYSELEDIYKDAKILLGEQIKKTFQELIFFNKSISTERISIIKERLDSLDFQLVDIDLSLDELNKNRAEALSFIKNSSFIEKQKEITKETIRIQSNINEISKTLNTINDINKLSENRKNTETNKENVCNEIEINLNLTQENENSLYNKIKNKFSAITREVLNKSATIITTQNKEGNLEFNAGFLNDDGKLTSESDGHSYQKILCFAYDLAINITYKDKKFPKFIYHDGGLETLDSRKKEAYLNYVRCIPEENGIQYILTAIDSDIPFRYVFRDEEIILTLHDKGIEGRLFKMKLW